MYLIKKAIKIQLKKKSIIEEKKIQLKKKINN